MNSVHELICTRGLKPNRWSWIPSNISEKRFVRLDSSNRLVLNPILSFGTVAWRGNKRLTENTIAYWEIQLEGSLYGTSVQFGVGRRNTMCHAYEFTDLLGINENSYGLDYQGNAQRSGMKVRVTLPIEGPNNRIGLLFDGPDRSLSFFINDCFLCTPFVDIDLSEILYPFVSSTAQCTIMTLCNQYSKDQIFSLLSLTRKKVYDSFDFQFLKTVLPRDVL